MKSLMILTLGFLLTHSPAHAEWIESEKLISDQTTTVDLALNRDTVLCSHADYQAPFLKILIPELADLTVLNHRNLGAGAPCVASGTCFSGNEPNDLIDPERPVEAGVPVRVTLKRNTIVDTERNTCHVSLVENIELTVRGKRFFHQRQASLGERMIQDCDSE